MPDWPERATWIWRASWLYDATVTVIAKQNGR